jgi:hypothetical protein
MANQPGFILDPKKGGINWGWCLPQSAVNPQVEYSVTIVTSSLPLSGTRYLPLNIAQFSR